MKKALSFILLFALLVSTFSLVASASSQTVNVYIDNVAFTGNVSVKDSTTFVAIRKFSTSMYSNAKVTYNYSSRTLTVKTDKLTLSATDGSYYIVANGRYLYTPTPVFMRYGVMYAPISLMAKAFDAKLAWSNSSSGFLVTRGTGGILSGDKFYREDEVYWLSKIINAESGGEILRGKIAVGNVILNRVKSNQFPNTIYSVIFDRKYGVQFSPVSNGTIYNSPNQESIIAAKICLEGYSISSSILYFVNPTVSPSNWITNNRKFFAKIGNHAFYY